ncbi:hypothetical protein BACIH_0381 [Bacillus amyloliquefaciens]|nr:hypothetical protein U471_04060 [Bacillus amyloliquefaciens CC178]QBG54810.1 hypothetical protein D2M30_0445 [Bacillus amyloliquefaciens]RAP16581.1 hypothetical protein C2W63_03483 [Bacillus velezensis]QEY89248.1 hypothetical protein BACIT_1321 [Bacillus amyloliquefaciens]QEY92171.1 hypothetical protein BACIH_0381 [Bacillus amyloliquefaciens]
MKSPFFLEPLVSLFSGIAHAVSFCFGGRFSFQPAKIVI